MMLLECGSCPARGRACHDCAVGVLLSLEPPRPGQVCLDAAETAAVEAFVRAGLVDGEVADGLVAELEATAIAV